ncbi:opioid growth factor receptor isoform X2 [Paroedura picta]|uniref:opioid growth factor receptor isoform X2 n=1 Tax=Paroedura picta TaxID=143630 RepID=UPI004056FD00
MAARLQAAEDDPGSEEEEEEEEGRWEYDSTWEGEEEEEEEEEGRLREGAEEEPERKGAEAATAAAKSDKLRSPRKGRSLSAKQASGSQEWRWPNRSTIGFGRYTSPSRRNWMAAKDMQRYRHHYPDLEETDTETKEDEMWNLSFYRNEISFVPRGLYIEDLLEKWQHDYAVMEENHSYIQWLFPLREQGMNWRAKMLTCQEIQAFRKSKDIMDRFVRAYKLMLGFYGVELIDEETGELRRASNYRERFWNLNQYTHNNLRITRILKCLGEMGKEHYQVHLVKFFLTETLVHQTLPRVRQSALDYFMFTVRNKRKRRELVHFAWQHFEPKQDFVWGPRKKLLQFRPLSSGLLNNAARTEESATAAEGAEQNKSQSAKETCVDGDLADGSNDMAKGKSGSGGDAAGTQPTNKHKTSEKAEDADPGSTSEVKAEGEDVEARAPGGDLKPDGRGSPSDPISCRTDRESLKESKKRKFEVNKQSGESVGLSRSPTDIEKISSNLEGVVIGQEGPESFPLPENSESSPQEGNGSGGLDLREIDLVSAVVKRRKVDEIVPDEQIVGAARKLDAETTSFKSQMRHFGFPGAEKTAEVCPAGVQISNCVPSEAESNCRTAGGVDVSVNSEASAAHFSLPSGDSEPDSGHECLAISTAEGERSQSCSALITRQEVGNSGQEEAGMKGSREEGGAGQEGAGMKEHQEEAGPRREEAGIKGSQEEDGSGQEGAGIKGRQEEGGPGQEGAGMKGSQEDGGSGQEEAGMKGSQEDGGSGQEEAGLKGSQEEGGPRQEGAGMKGRQEERGSGQEEAGMKGSQEEGGPRPEEVEKKGRGEGDGPVQEGSEKEKPQEAADLNGTVKSTESNAFPAETEGNPR